LKFSDIDLNLFLLFEAIYRERNMTRAGQALGISQSAVSNALNKLRDQFNDPLFVRTRRGMMPTPFADNMIAHVRTGLEHLEISLQENHEFDPATHNRIFNISMSDLSELVLLPKLMEIVSQEAPHVVVECYPVERRDIGRSLSSGSIDIAIDVPIRTDATIKNELLYNDRHVCLMRKGHPQRKRKLTMDSFKRMRHLHLSSRRHGAGIIDFALDEINSQRNVALRARHFLIGPFVVANSDLVAELPLRYAQLVASYFPLTYVDLPFDRTEIATHIYWHEKLGETSAVKWLRSLVARVAAN